MYPNETKYSICFIRICGLNVVKTDDINHVTLDSADKKIQSDYNLTTLDFIRNCLTLNDIDK